MSKQGLHLECLWILICQVRTKAQAMTQEVNDLGLKMCDSTSSTAQPRFLQSGVSSPKIGWNLAPSDKPKRVEQTCCPPSLQDGRDQNATRADPGRGLASEAGPQECLPDCPHCIQLLTFPPLLVRLPVMGIQ